MGKINDLKGERFGKLEVLCFEGLNNHRKATWLCECECGNQTVVVGSSLKSGLVKSCGCYKISDAKERFSKDITGLKFGKLTVIEREGTKVNGRSKLALWKCQCDCGNTVITRGSGLRNGRTKSCGCLQRENASLINTTHGKSKTPIYRIWSKMLRRCTNPNDQDYNHYGGRGIKVCDRWKSFELFYEDIGQYHKKDLTLDRIDVNGDYELSNCRWATRLTQSNNTRRNTHIEFNGIEYTIAELASEYEIKYSVLYRRLKRGWEIEKAISEPVREFNN